MHRCDTIPGWWGRRTCSGTGINSWRVPMVVPLTPTPSRIMGGHGCLCLVVLMCLAQARNVDRAARQDRGDGAELVAAEAGLPPAAVVVAAAPDLVVEDLPVAVEAAAPRRRRNGKKRKANKYSAQVSDLDHSATHHHDKGHHDEGPKHHESHHEQGGGHRHHAEHHNVEGHKGDKGYKGHHEDEEKEQGHHDKERKKGHYEEDGGKKSEHHDGSSHYGEHHHGEEGEKGAKYGEEGDHKKGHSTKGEHNVHKKNEYEKKHEFYDEHHEGGDHEKHGDFDEHHEEHDGGHEKKGHHHSGHHEEHHGKKGHHEKGHHEHDHKGHKDHKEHDEHHDHHEEHGKKHGDEEGKKWDYKKSHSSGAGETGDPREDPPTNGIFRYNSHLRKSGEPAGDLTRFALVGGERANRFQLLGITTRCKQPRVLGYEIEPSRTTGYKWWRGPAGPASRESVSTAGPETRARDETTRGWMRKRRTCPPAGINTGGERGGGSSGDPESDMRFPGCVMRPSACLLFVAVIFSGVRRGEGFAVHRQDDVLPGAAQVIAQPASYTYVTTMSDQRPAPTGQRLSRRPPHAVDEAKVASHQTVVHHGGRRRLEVYPAAPQKDAFGNRRAASRYEKPQISESQHVERKEAAHRRPAYVDAPSLTTEKKSAKYSRSSFEGEKSHDLEPRRLAGTGRRHFADVEHAGVASRREEQKAARRPSYDEIGPRSQPSHHVEQKTYVKNVPSFEEEEEDKGRHRASHVVEHKVRSKPEDHYHTASEVVKQPAPFKAHHSDDQKQSASDDHKKGHHHHHHHDEHHEHHDGGGGHKKGHDEHHEKGGGHKHHGEHHQEEGHKGEKGYKGHHGHEEGEHGHHDKEHHKKHYEEKGGKEHEHHDEDGHYGEHHHEEEGDKGAKYGEEGEHKKGHSTKGEHNIHKKDEYEKKHEFYDEHHEGGDHEKHGEFDEHHEEHDGGHEKKGHHHGGHHEEHHGKKGHHEKGHHEHDHKGHKDHKEHDEYHDHHEEHGKKHGDEEGKKWAYKKSDKGRRR
ncbi:hypothetical protein PR048_033434 [Dryococelus australis]|uniref:Uncharacterized protein n=1 Tax=Dryococelus australis TaxID=614101 RepID=A0ABQ9G0A1_9NEOP|nr:hypothetical protein PR048_033434 [Dryococelus australis]